MKILVVCQYYYPESFQINDICQDLVQHGHDITVVTGLPNYPTGVIPKEYRNGQKHSETINGVKVIRCFEIGRRKGVIGLVANYLSFCISAWLKIKKIDKDFDLVFVYQLSPVLMGIPALRYKKLHHKPLVLYCCDIWPESMKMIVKNENSVAFHIISYISRRIYQSCDKILVQTKLFFPYFKSFHGIADNCLLELPQFANAEYLNENFSSENGIADFVFLGNIGIAQNLKVLIAAAEKIKHIDNFVIHLVGNGRYVDELKELVIAKGLQDKVIFYGRRPLSEMPDFYKLADICVVSLNNDNLTGVTIPAKVQGYMAAGKAILGIIDGATKEVILNSGCGVCVPVNDVEELAAVMEKIINNLQDYTCRGQKGREYFKEHFSQQRYITTLENSFWEVLGK